MIKSINSWFSKYKKFLLIYRDGFWDIPYLANSPETIVKSTAKMPFTKHFSKKQLIRSTTPLINGELFYEKIEEGLWVIVSNLKYKANINYKKVNDDSIQTDWYLLGLTIFGMKQNLSLVNGVSYTNCSWLLFKPNTWIDNYHFKGAEEIGFSFYFNESWIKKHLYSKEAFKTSSIRHFFESDTKYLIWYGEVETYKALYEKIYENFYNSTVRTNEAREELQSYVHQMLTKYVSEFKQEKVNSNYFNLVDKDIRIIHKVEKILLQRLTKPFPSIETLSKEAGVSETNLKAKFKLAFGKTIFQYFQEKQMLLAKDILVQEKNPISELAKLIGYKSVGKFSAAFKKQIGTLPSELVNKIDNIKAKPR